MNIAMVNYYNTLPFLEGLNDVEDYNMILDIPSECLGYYIRNEADIALVPVGALIEIPKNEYQVISDYCIGCDDEVGTVSLFSNTDLENITTIYLDGHSRTSAKLVQVLSKELWKINPVFKPYNGQPIEENEGVLLIGDKVFNQIDDFKFNHDLGSAWMKLTGLSFAFAVWIAKPEIGKETIDAFNYSLKSGVDQINTIDWNNRVEGIDLVRYYNDYIDYSFDEKKKKAVNEFSAYVFNSLQDL